MFKRILQILILIVCVCFLNTKLLFAWSEYLTHPALTEYAVRQHSQLENYLKNYLGINEGRVKLLNTNVDMKDLGDPTILNFLKLGGILEDDAYRGYNHFHEPINNAKLHDWVAFLNLFPCPISGDYTNQNWATQDNTGNDYSWVKARQYYIDALTTSVTQQREDSFAKTFRSVGQVMHLIEDMAVPVHT